MATSNHPSLVLDRRREGRTRTPLAPLGQRLMSALRRVWIPRHDGGDTASMEVLAPGPETAAGQGAPRFPLARHGYDRIAVDRHVGELEQELSVLDRELAALRTRTESAREVTTEIERIGEQTTAVLLAAHEQREQMLSAARAEADRCLAEARAAAEAATVETEARLRGIEAQNQNAERERARLIAELRRISSGLAAVADSAAPAA